MKIKFYGTRGSIPVCDTQFQRFGGNTSCVSIEFDDQLLIIDAGTGIRNLGKELLTTTERKNIQIAFTHFHWDHIQGLPFFLPSYKNDYCIHLSSLDHSKHEQMDQAIRNQMNSTYFPIPFEEMGANFYLDPLHIPTLETIELNHPGGCFGFKLTDSSGKKLVYLVDHEHTTPIEPRFVSFCKNADLLIHDGQYTFEQYPKYINWGHSNHQQAIDLAIRSNAKKLIITHHDPEHNDQFLLNEEIKCQERFKNLGFAREGDCLEI